MIEVIKHIIVMIVSKINFNTLLTLKELPIILNLQSKSK